MDSKPGIAFLSCILSLSLAAPGPLACSQSVSGDSHASNSASDAIIDDAQIPLYAAPQDHPCPDQTKSYSKLHRSYTAGHVPSPKEVTGSWVLIGSRMYRDSHPDLNCTGIMRGIALEWVMIAQGYSLENNMIGATTRVSAFELGKQRDLTVALDLGGDASPTLSCRMTQGQSLVCLGNNYYKGLEFRKLPVHCQLPKPHTPDYKEPLPCFPGNGN